MDSTDRHRSNVRRRMVLGAVAATLVVAAACGDDTPPSVESDERSTTTEQRSSTTSDTTNTTEGTISTTVPSSTTTTSGTGGTSTGGAVADEDAPDPTWDLTAAAYRGRNGLKVAVNCPPAGEAGSVWGATTYTDDSSICTAAVHAGLISLASGGRVVIEIRSGQETYEGTTSNGVTSSAYGSWGGSYVFVAA